jgi:hypothetical protein
VASSRPARTAASRAAHSTSSSRVRGNTTPSGTPRREWLERPTRWRKVPIERGEPTWHTSSTGPTSMPSSSEAVATRALSSPARRRASTRWRRSLERLPWWAETASGPRRWPRRWARRSDIRRVFTNTSVVRCAPTWPAMRSTTSSNCSVEATADSSPPGSSTRSSIARACPQSTTATGRGGPPGSTPPRSRAVSSMGRWVADSPMRCGRRAPAWSESRRSRVRARWAPRLSRARAWISSTMTVRTEPSMARLRAALTMR